MNQPLFLHIVERLEGLLARLPATIQKPILHELTPLKQLFLQQRPPRFVLTGANTSPTQEVIAALLPTPRGGELQSVLTEVFRWQNLDIGGLGHIEVLDARGSDAVARPNVEAELRRQPADIFLFIDDESAKSGGRARELANLSALLQQNAGAHPECRVAGVVLRGGRSASLAPRAANGNGAGLSSTRASELATALTEAAGIRDRLVGISEVQIGALMPAPGLMSMLALALPNEARVEMIRISRDREAQMRIAQTLVKSTSAICTAVGTQPIPLADLPILTTLQLVMVSGIMYLSGREKSLRAATEFVTALGANVGAGMLLREGARAVLKFFPGWGNIVCGMVAGAGTYAIGRAAMVYFIGGMSLKDARRTYLSSRKKRARPALVDATSAG